VTTAPVRVHVGTDHAGFEFKEHLVAALRADGHEVVDHGAANYDAQDDYPPFCFAAAEAVRADPGSLGVVIGGSGNGEQISANKVPGIRAALAWNADTARLARQHNDAQVVAIGARQHTADEATGIVRAFLAEPFGGDDRHARRIRLIADYEAGHGAGEAAGG
jgi:ribose 5-phosphate isomerase B